MVIPSFELHVHRRTSFGADIYVLETGAAIGPEAEAMIQALHSRSIGGFKAHLQKLAEKGPEKFMSSHYVGYGHKSIGDCGTTTLFIEGVSMLAAKAVQDWMLYSGQESSTRYLDFSTQPFMDVTQSDAGRHIQEGWRLFYLALQDPVRQSLREQFPRQDDEKEAVWEKAIAARAFDITRAFLPAGATTNLSWHSNLRQVADKLALLRHHPLPEVAELGRVIEEAVVQRFPSSFSKKRYEETEAYNARWMGSDYYYHDLNCPDFELVRNEIHLHELMEYRHLLQDRPSKTELPRHLDELGRMQFRFLLDFGSFRDIQRQRAVTQRMPLLTEQLGFHPWYLQQLPGPESRDAVHHLARHRRWTNKLKLSPEIRQYYVPMGYLTSNRLTAALPQLVYLVELRATRFVHPTLSIRANQMAQTLLRLFSKSGLVLHLDPEPGRFDIRRGTHDITEK